MRFFATCAKGTEGALRRELSGLRLPAVRGDRGGVSFEGALEAGMRACLHARTAMRVLLELARFPAPDAAALYEGARAVAWQDWLDVRTTLAVEATVSSTTITHSGFAALKVKDAAVDVLRERLGARPDVDPKDPDVRIVLHLARDEATLSLDLAGAPLHRRGYRAVTTEAPLKETLAAAVLLLGGVDPALPFADPMAGSGTLAIEHALRARRIAPGLDRAFGFQRWPGYRGGPQSAWDRMKAAARAEILPRAPAPIVARDGHPKAIQALRLNAAAAGVEADLEISQADARDLQPSADVGAIVTNPPYGERLGGGGEGASAAEARVAGKKLQGFYRGLAEMLVRHHGWTAVLLSGNPLLERAIPIRPAVDHRLWNGPLEAHLLKYELP
ncbi:putative RNA methylase [Anaeromyxobacter sp. K]|uniref:THUMP domain-containing class I SAM-dependent RNA methyltransferase n=1 Tax=Anaeromyxobacter sp. (strain K) TaxID=447217 RepID=UPI00015F8D0A|nr:THUMP domain-containing protein [Anaeromyxobacter sp. K]ACG75331.1 putative RNA methylase [Anaeromyxobacter sp. K]